MKQVLFATKLLCFWLIFFTIQQILFLGYHFDDPKGSLFDIFISFVKGFELNISTACYLIAFPILALIGSQFGLTAAIVNKTTKWISYFFIIISSIIICSDISLYSVWGTKINSKAIGYMQYPKELMPTVFTSQNTFLFILIALQIILGIWLYKNFIKSFTKEKNILSTSILVSISLLFGLVIGFRGGFQRVPINRNWVFHSQYPILNYGSLNSFWNFADILMHPLETQGNPYAFFDVNEARDITDEMHFSSKDTTIQILNNSNPNIVIIFLESWSADVIACLGGEEKVTPKICELAKEGLLFTNFYSTGYRTEQGFLATLSSTPALPVGSVIQTFGKFDKLPNLYRTFNQRGYHTSFYSGGRLFFDNVEAYLRSAGVNTMKGENEWTINKRTVWGAYDEETFALHLNEMQQTPQPFFSALTTMTTHEWFDADVPQIFKGDDKVNDGYRNTMHYADSCLYAYLQEAKKQPWYANTVYIIVADHACKFPKGRNNFEVDRHHIPMLITGGALKNEWKGNIYNQIASHVDIAATLLGQLKIDASDYPYSKNLFNLHSPRFAYYAFDNGFGIVHPKGNLIYDHNRDMVSESSIADSTELKTIEKYGKAYLQVQFQNNLDVISEKHRHGRHHKHHNENHKDHH